MWRVVVVVPGFVKKRNMQFDPPLFHRLDAKFLPVLFILPYMHIIHSLKGHPHASIMYPRFWAEFLAVLSKYYGGLREYYVELSEFPDKSSNFGLLYGRVYGP